MRATYGGPLEVRVALFVLRFYKSHLSMLFQGNCRFAPTCSAYAYQAIARFGLLRGAWLAFLRLLRCHPLSGRFGYDPVPEAWAEHSGAQGLAATSVERQAGMPDEVHS